jgi:hypothetical protein
MTATDTEAPETTPETEETPAPVIPDVSALNDLGRMILAQIQEDAAAFNAEQARYDAATGDRSKAVHDLREASDDAKVVKFRKWLADIDAKREAAVTEIDAYISENLMPAADLSEADAETLKTSLAEKRKELKNGMEYFSNLPAVRAVENAHLLLPEIKGARKGVSKGTGTGAPKPRVKAIYVDGELMSHDVTKDGETVVKSSFTDAVKFLSDKHDVKIQTSDLHSGYFAAAQVEPADWASGPDSVEYVFHVTDKAGASHNHKVLVTK